MSDLSKNKLGVSFAIVGAVWLLFEMGYSQFASTILSNWLFLWAHTAGGIAGALLSLEWISFAVLSAPLILGIWISFKINRASINGKKMAISLVIGISLTILSLSQTNYIFGLAPVGLYPFTSYGLPLDWLVINMGPSSVPGVGFDPFPLLIDTMFWVALAYAGLLLSSTLMRMQHRPADRADLISKPSPS